MRIKSIHAQNTPAETGLAGQRLALNIANVEKEDIQRGDWITELEPKFATDRITVQLCANQAFKENSMVHLYHFASHITGKLNLLEATQAVKNPQTRAELRKNQTISELCSDWRTQTR